MRLSFNQTNEMLKEALCKSYTKQELIEVIEHAVDSLDAIQQQFVLVNRSVITDTNE